MFPGQAPFFVCKELDIPPSLRESIRNFGRPPRQFSLWERWSYLNPIRPMWVRIDPLQTLFRNLHELYSNGIVVWGHVVQANCRMFEPGTANLPGEIVYSLDEGQNVDHLYLGTVANELLSLKGGNPGESELAQIAEYLTDERARVFGLKVPPTISLAPRCQISTTLFVRKHLPSRRVCSPILPVIVNPGEPRVVLPLPMRYWSKDVVDWWLQPHPIPFDEALKDFAEHGEVLRLQQEFVDAGSAVEFHKDLTDCAAAAYHRERKLKTANELELLLEQLWRERDGP